MAQEKASARLKGLNMFNAFDLEGSGTIDTLVLTRSLKIFDPIVFTDDTLEAMVAAIDGVSSKVQLQTLTDWLRAAAPLVEKVGSEASMPSNTVSSRRSSKAEEFIEPLNAYVDSLVCDIKGFKEVVDVESLTAASGDSEEDLDALKASLKLKAKEYVLEAQRKNIRPLWDDFDADGNGVLDPGECAKLVASYLGSMVEKAGDIMRGFIELGIELSIICSSKKVHDEAVAAAIREQGKKQVEAIHSKVAPLVRDMLQKMAAEDPQIIADELLSTLDLDKDGRVTRDEFEQRFVESLQYVLGPERLMDKLKEVNKLG